MRQWIGVALIALAIVAAGIAPPADDLAQAQGGGSLGYGSKVIGRVLADTPVVIYSFNGNAGDLAQVGIRNWVGSLDPHVDLVGPDGQTMARSANRPFAQDPLETYLSLYLPQSGVYMLLVSGENGTTGEFLLKLQGRGAVIATPLIAGQGIDVNVPLNPPPQYFSFEAQACPTVLTVANLSEGQPFTFPFVVKVRNPQGGEIAFLRGSDALEDRVIVAALSGRYEVEVISDDPQAQGTVHLLAACADQAPGCVAGSLDLAGEAGAGRCPSCFEEFGGELCDAFNITAAVSDDAIVTFTWTPVEGAERYIFSINDASGMMLGRSAVMLEGGDTTSHTFTFAPDELSRGPFVAIVRAVAEGIGYLCIAETPFGFEGETAGECSGITVAAHIASDADRVAVAEWSAAPGAAAYLIHVYAYGDDGGLIGIRVFTVPGDHTTFHLEGVFPSDYARFHIEVDAYAEASGGGAFGDMPQGYLCSGSADVEFSQGPVHWGPAA